MTRTFLTRRLGAMALALGLVLVPAAVTAHHGWSGYGDALVELTGTVTAVSTANPHATLRLQTPEKLWLITLSPPARMQARGLSADSIRVGDTASVAGYVRTDDPDELRAEWIRVGGTQIPLR